MFIAMALDVMVITRKPATGARRPSIRAFRNLLRTSLADPTGSYSGLRSTVRDSGMAAWEGEIPDEKIWF